MYPYSATYAIQSGDKQVSVIMRTKNRPILLVRAISSVAEQLYQNWHLYIVNDGGDQRQVEQCIDLFPSKIKNKISVIHHENSIGMEAASNSAINIISSEFSVIHDDDDSWDKAFLKECVYYLSSKDNQNYAGVVTHTTLIREAVSENEIHYISECEFNNWYDEIDLYRLLGENTFAPISFVFRTALINKIGKFNQDLLVLGDWDFNIRALLVADIGVLPKKLAFYHHRVPGENGAYNNSVTHQIDRHLKMNILYRNSLLRKAAHEAPWLLGIIINEAKNNYILNNRISELERRFDTAMHKIQEANNVSNEINSMVKRIFGVLSTLAKPILFIKRKVLRIY